MATTILPTLIVMAVLATHPTPVSKSNPDPAQYLTHDQVAQIYKASTPDDHRALAQYFRQEARRKREKEQYYLETSATYRRHPPRVDAYRTASIADYYQHLADEARDTAVADDQMAIVQDRLAEGFVQSK